MSPQQTNPAGIAESLITSESFDVLPESTTTVCTMRVGQFVVIGKSACVDPAKFNAALGRQYARQDALNQLIAHVAFFLVCGKPLVAAVEKAMSS